MFYLNKHLCTFCDHREQTHSTWYILLYTLLIQLTFTIRLSLWHILQCTRKTRRGLLSSLLLKKVARTGRKEGTVLWSVCTQKRFCYAKEVDHLGNAKERSYYNHTASCASEEYCRSLVPEKGTAIKSRLHIKVQRAIQCSQQKYSAHILGIGNYI